MKGNIKKWSIKILAIIMVFSSFTVAASAATNVKTGQANLFSFTGSVTISQGGTKIVKAFNGMRLQSGYSVKTGADSGAYISIDSDKVLRMDQNTHVKLSKVSGNKINISLVSGKIFNDIKSKLPEDAQYTVTTANSVMGVRGTVFSVGASGVKGSDGIERVSTQVMVFEGAVAMEDTVSKKQIEVPQGQQASNQNVTAEEVSKPLAAAPITDAQISSFEGKALKEVERNIPMLENKNLDTIIEKAQEKEVIEQKQKEQEKAVITEQIKSETKSNFAKNDVATGLPVGMTPGADAKEPITPPSTGNGSNSGNSSGGGSSSGGRSKPEPQPPTYSVSVSQGISHGKVNVSQTSARAGTIIEIEGIPEADYLFEGWKITGAKVAEEVAKTTFVMQSNEVVIGAIFGVRDAVPPVESEKLGEINNLRIYSISEDIITFKWDAAENAESYRVKAGYESDVSEDVDNGNVTQFIVKRSVLNNHDGFIIDVEAVNKEQTKTAEYRFLPGNIRENSLYLKGESIKAPSYARISNVSDENKETITFAWEPVDGASLYNIEVTGMIGQSSHVFQQKETTLSIKSENIKQGEAVSIKVSAVGEPPFKDVEGTPYVVIGKVSEIVVRNNASLTPMETPSNFSIKGNNMLTWVTRGNAIPSGVEIQIDEQKEYIILYPAI